MHSDSQPGAAAQEKPLTIAISLKVNDGVVLAADSASTLFERDPSGETRVVNVYNNANKVFNLKKGLPIGAITWGSGSIGAESISTLAKDLRRRLAGKDPAHQAWGLNHDTYTVQGVAQRLREFMYEEKYQPAFQDWPEKPALGFIVAGYSAGAPLAEEYQVFVNVDSCHAPEPVRAQQESGLAWRGEPEAISRLVLGFSPRLEQVLTQNLGVPAEQAGPAMAVISEALRESLVSPAMPIQDAIDLADFLVDTAINFSRFRPGASTVGGPIEIAAITKHEGFKWVRRKHYYSRELNPEVE
jgi:hypothetical protein